MIIVHQYIINQVTKMHTNIITNTVLKNEMVRFTFTMTCFYSVSIKIQNATLRQQTEAACCKVVIGLKNSRRNFNHIMYRKPQPTHILCTESNQLSTKIIFDWNHTGFDHNNIVDSQDKKNSTHASMLPKNTFLFIVFLRTRNTS